LAACSRLTILPAYQSIVQQLAPERTVAESRKTRKANAMNHESNWQREATAYHEAGHVVVTHALGYKPKSVTIVPTRDAHGIMHYPNPLRGIQLDIDGSDRARLLAEQVIKICYAGPLAQQRYRPRSWRRYHGASYFDMATDLGVACLRFRETSNRLPALA
jgi:hypothetical protein